MKKKKLILLFILVGILTLAGFIWYWLDSNRVVNRAVEKLAQANTQSFTGNVTILNQETGQELLGEQASIDIAVSGLFERQAEGWDSLSADVKITTETESVSMRIEGKIIFIGDKAYVKIIKAPPAFPALVQLKDIWIALPRGGDKTLSQLNSNGALFTNTQRIGIKDIDGKKINTYQAEADQTVILHMMDGVAGLLGTRLSEEQIAGFRNQVKNADSAIIEMAIAPWTRDLHWFAATLATPDSNEIDLTLTLKNRNHPVDIVAPADAVSLEDVLTAAKAQNTKKQPVQ